MDPVISIQLSFLTKLLNSIHVCPQGCASNTKVGCYTQGEAAFVHIQKISFLCCGFSARLDEAVLEWVPTKGNYTGHPLTWEPSSEGGIPHDQEILNQSWYSVVDNHTLSYEEPAPSISSQVYDESPTTQICYSGLREGDDNTIQCDECGGDYSDFASHTCPIATQFVECGESNSSSSVIGNFKVEVIEESVESDIEITQTDPLLIQEGISDPYQNMSDSCDPLLHDDSNTETPMNNLHFDMSDNNSDQLISFPEDLIKCFDGESKRPNIYSEPKDIEESSLQGKYKKRKKMINKSKGRSVYAQRQPRCSEAFTCDICGVSFTGRTRRQEFSHHMNREHTKEIIFKCPMCHKEFWHQKNLRHHIRSHEQPSKLCSVCNRTFKTQTHLKTHMLTHSEHKAHVCQYCRRSFKRKDHLTVHERLHTGEKPFVCTFCFSAYPQKIQLIKHQKSCFTKVISGECGDL
ncbi:uncharacterized protein LOC143035110 [Oratosquilla oratoria]|uniref:uncharacterized protein LOC143035110 n=1 Tax=Oratosquilla oratoria TaxID=337810 RepID=UPI003F769322